jgi:hypothetical protein
MSVDSINGNNASVVSNITYNAGEVGRAFQFDGTTSLITVPANTSLALSNVTLEAWIYPTDLNTIRPIFDYGGAGQEASISLWLNTQNGLSLNPGGLHGLIRGPTMTSPVLEVDTVNTPVQLNQWNHVVFTADLRTLIGILYWNGTPVKTNTATGPVIPPSFEPVNLGYRDVGSLEVLAGRRYKGQSWMRQAIYSRPLVRQSEIKAIYQIRAAQSSMTPSYIANTNAPSIATRVWPRRSCQLNGTQPAHLLWQQHQLADRHHFLHRHQHQHAAANRRAGAGHVAGCVRHDHDPDE